MSNTELLKAYGVEENYSIFLKAYQVEVSKSYFPCTWFGAAAYEDCYSTLRGFNVLAMARNSSTTSSHHSIVSNSYEYIEMDTDLEVSIVLIYIFFSLFFFIYLFVWFFSCKNLHPVAEFMKRGRELTTCSACQGKYCFIHNKRKYKCRACSPHIYFKNVLCYYVQYMLKNKIK